MSDLMVIESPSKIKSIGRFLKDYDIKLFATYGHIRELPKRWLQFGPNNFEIKWVNSKKKVEYLNKKISVIEALKKEASKADKIYLSTDPDREGEAISWHAYSLIGEENQPKCQRVVFNEITEKAIKYSLNHPRDLNQAQINSYLARRLLDRWLGFKLSSYIHKKVGAISAGRVQSIALKFLADRDEEIKNFKSEVWYNLVIFLNIGIKLYLSSSSFELGCRQLGKNIQLSPNGSKHTLNFVDREDALHILNQLKNTCILEKKNESEEEYSNPPKPLKTSTMYEVAINKLGFKTLHIEKIAQKLYEGIQIGDEIISLITYPRTDRTQLSEDFISELKKYILEAYGHKYWIDPKQSFISEREALFIQGAHEGIRPVDLEMTPERLSSYISIQSSEYRLYSLIWAWTIASFSTPFISRKIRYIFSNQNYEFDFLHTVEVFDGYKRIFREYSFLDQSKEVSDHSMELNLNAEYTVDKLEISTSHTNPPPKYTESSLIKALEERGIGRPSTYPTISKVVQSRNYVKYTNKKFEITELGYKVSKDLEKNFSNFIAYDYTRHMEEELDNISKSKSDWREFLNKVFESWDTSFSKADKYEVFSDIKCAQCGKNLVYKFSKKGVKFIGCIGYPECTYILNSQTAEWISEDKLCKLCPMCGSEMIQSETHSSQNLNVCSDFPNCKYMEKQALDIEFVEDQECPKCSGKLIYRTHNYKSSKYKFIACQNFPKCRYTSPIKKTYILLERKCLKCNSFLVQRENKWGKTFIACSGFPKCRYIESSKEASKAKKS